VATCASAQEFRATITGLVTDPSGAAIPGATVRATNIANNATKEVQTTAAGVYTIPYLDPGVYTIEVTMTGFQTLKREQIVLRVADRVNLPLQLTVGNVATEITVVGQQEVLETADANRGLNFDPIKTQQYPLNGRQTYMLLMLTPGVNFTQEAFGPNDYTGTRAWDNSGAYRFGAARSGGTRFLLNGGDITYSTGNWSFAPNIEAVQEFKVMTNTYDATYGIFTGGIVNTTTKSGTNNWHGDVFEFWRNSIFDANYFQNKANPDKNGKPAPYGLHNQHQFGGVLGGPLRKDKDFAFFSYEGWQEVIPFPALSTVPPALLRDGQHFTDYGIKIFDPMTMRFCEAKAGDVCSGAAVNNSTRTYINDVFANNAIPANRISPIGQKILALWPVPNTVGDTPSIGTPQAYGLGNNFAAQNNPSRYYYEQPMVRWDHVFSEKDKLYAFFSYQTGREFNSSTGFPANVDGGCCPGTMRADHNAILDWTHVMSPTAVLDVNLSWGRFIETMPGYRDMSLKYTDVGIKTLPIAPTNALYQVIPYINMTGNTGLFSGSGSTYYRSPVTDYFNLTPSFTMSRGKHTLKFGFQGRYLKLGNYNTGASSGTFSFNSGTTQHYNGSALDPYDGSGIASLLLGIPSSGSMPYPDSYYYTRFYHSVYVQDDWKVTPKLSLNLGLRYDIEVGNKERYGRGTNRWDSTYKDPNTDKILAAWAANKATYDASATGLKDPFKYPAVPTQCCYGRYIYVKPGERAGDTDYTDFGPRIGAAYRLFSKTVIRTGIGIYYENAAQSLGSTSMFSQSTSYNATGDDGIHPRAGLTGPYSLENPYPFGLKVPPQRAWTGIGGSVSFLNAPYHIPRSWQYSFTIQQELPHSVSAEIGYNGNRTDHLAFSYNYNNYGFANRLTALSAPSGAYSYTGRTLANPFYGILDPLVGYGTSATISAGTLITPNPAYGSISESSIQAAHYRGDALTVKIEQRAMASESKGTLTWVLSYAFSKAFTDSGRLFGDYDLTLPLIHSADSSLKPHNIAFSGVYDLPFGKGKKWANTNKYARTVIGDWRFDWSGVYVPGNGIGYFSSYFNFCGQWKATKQDENHWYNNRGTVAVPGDPLRDGKSCYGSFPTGYLNGYVYTPAPGWGVIPNYTSFMTSVRAPQAPQINIAFEKTFSITERYKMSIRGESFNLTNSPIRNSVLSSTYTNANFGVLAKSQRNWPRVCQISGKFYF